jgi:uncharacterized protein YecA (UPF0149 family)
MNNNILPLEEADKELAKLIEKVVDINKNYPRGNRPVIISDDNVSYKGKHIIIGRNESCPCDSGKKFKRCCGK